MNIPRVYVTEPCPLEGYDTLSVRVLANPTSSEWRTYGVATLGTPDCEECAKLNVPKVVRGRRASVPTAPPPSPVAYCPKCAEERAVFGQSMSLFYGPSLLGADVSAPEAAIAAFENDDLPDELLIWLLLLPHKVWTERHEAITKNVFTSSSSAS
jgi:hypothetical protein